MTWATVVTCFRLVLVPVFAGLWVAYAQGVSAGQAVENLRLAATLCFLTAAISDAVDGYIAKHFNQKSDLGAFLDPLADKLLLLTGISILTFVRVEGVESFPLWFFLLVLLRDLGLFAGVIYFHFRKGPIPIRPDWSGKVATALQMGAVLWILFQISWPGVIWIVAGAAFFTAWTLAVYLVQGRAYFKAR
jgi:CDP-diacylglycerol--glycerol-3-phosphate 3-phosphatidyltransferase